MEMEVTPRILLTTKRAGHGFNPPRPPSPVEAHEEIRGSDSGREGAVVLHFSGCGVKPWDLSLRERA